MVQISELPGTLVARHSDQDQWVKGVVSRICGVNADRRVLSILSTTALEAH